ncbi:MAG TPA: hypothetical protein VMH81_18365, partial [Bryobacteraceae bacterium]|nr:hypothetical protein [Bryobacteraceae bacterium]
MHRRIGAEHGWVAREEARRRALNTLRYYADRAPQEHGWFYHWLNVASGERTGASFDTAAMPPSRTQTGAAEERNLGQR